MLKCDMKYRTKLPDEAKPFDIEGVWNELLSVQQGWTDSFRSAATHFKECHQTLLRAKEINQKYNKTFATLVRFNQNLKTIIEAPLPSNDVPGLKTNDLVAPEISDGKFVSDLMFMLIAPKKTVKDGDEYVIQKSPRSLLQRLSILCAIKKTLIEALLNWVSKEAKLSERLHNAKGSTAAELQTAENMRRRAQEVIRVLHLRLEKVCDIFFDTRKRILVALCGAVNKFTKDLSIEEPDLLEKYALKHSAQDPLETLAELEKDLITRKDTQEWDTKLNSSARTKKR